MTPWRRDLRCSSASWETCAPARSRRFPRRPTGRSSPRSAERHIWLLPAEHHARFGSGRFRGRAGSVGKIRYIAAMNRTLLISTILVATVFTSHSAISEEAPSKLRPLKCDVGPVGKTYGETQWLVYS